MSASLIVFRVNDRRWAVGAEQVKGIFPLPPLTPAPGAPAYVTGVCALRGQITPVIDLAAFWQLPGRSAYSSLLLLEAEGGPVAVLAEQSLERLARPETSPPPAPDNGFACYIQTILPDGAALLDLTRLLAALSRRE